MTGSMERAGSRPALAVATAAMLALSWSSTADGQTPDMRTVTYTGAGYSGNLPGVLTGLGVFHLIPDWGFGVFVNGHMTLDSPADDPSTFFEDRTSRDAREAAHERVGEEDIYRSVTAGVVWPFDPEIAAYAGAGFTRERRYEEFWNAQDPDMGDFGHYWVEDPGEARDGVNITAGLFMQAGRHLFFRVGGETFPLGGSLGVYWALPR